MIIIVFVILSEFTGWYGSGLLHEVGTIKILVIPGQTSARARDVTLLSWRAIADQTCVVDLIFLNFLCGGLTIFDLFHNGGLSACLTFSWIPLGASSSACLSSASRSFKSVPSDLLKLAGSLSSSSSLSCSSREESEKFLFTNEVSAALDTKFTGLCVSAKTRFKIWYQWGSFSGSSPEPVFARFVLFIHSVLNHFYFCRSFSIDISNFVRVLLK